MRVPRAKRYVSQDISKIFGAIYIRKLSNRGYWEEIPKGEMRNIIEPQTVSSHPMPLSYYINLDIGSRASFYRWEKMGLEVLRIGRCVFIDPVKLTEFMHEQSNEAQ